MCGLFGCFQPEGLDQSDLRRARSARDCLFHRGPDQVGDRIHGGLYIGHRRLSILDLSEKGRQPMWDESNQVAITINGEIYNFDALRKELIRAGYKFSSSSDSEVALYGYSHWGLNELANRIDGMYVIIIYDHYRRKLHAIRDRVGIKPLYYFYDGKRFAWASELKALRKWLTHGDLQLDEIAIFDFLTYRFIPAPKSMYRLIRKLESGTSLSFDLQDTSLRTEKYWTLPQDQIREPDEYLADKLLSRLEASVKDQLVSDVPLGFLLSGGIDSSAVTMFGARHADPALAFSISFAEQGRDESPFAKEVADLAAARHFTKVFPNSELTRLRPMMLEWFDEPFCDTSALPTHLVSQFARQHVTVALTGDGGDELFGGYKWYKQYEDWMLKRKDSKGNLLKFAKRIVGINNNSVRLEEIDDPVELYALIRKALPANKLETWRRRLNIPADYDPYWAFRAHFDPALPPRRAAQVIDFHTYLPDDILTKVDRASMQVALECRPPFLGKEVIEFAFSLPESFVYKDGELKGGLKWALRDILPDSIRNREKLGFSIPDDGWKSTLIKEHGSLQEAFLAATLSQAE